jgi:uncharacterized protein YyaL (SSP411 family)
MRVALVIIFAVLFCAVHCPAASPHELKAYEVMKYIQQNYYNPSSGLYSQSPTKRDPEFMWGNGVMFSALVGATRHDPNFYRPIMDRFFKSMDKYWDEKAPIPGYEPSPTSGDGNDKYYDDNEWMAITFTEAYELTRDDRYLHRAIPVLKFALSGWDDELGGGIWWHEAHKGDSKNTCANAPAAVACLRLAKFLSSSDSKSAVNMGSKIVDWTSTHLENDNGLFADNENVATQKVNHGTLTYNTALMIRANLELYHWTINKKYLTEAQREAKASDALLDHKTGAYRDSLKWSHLSMEADLELYRTTHEDYLLARAKSNADHSYETWKTNPPKELIDNAAIARELWLMADTETDAGKQFWARADQVPH